MYRDLLQIQNSMITPKIICGCDSNLLEVMVQLSKNNNMYSMQIHAVVATRFTARTDW